MPLITRQGKGEKLTIEEMDDNLTYLEGLARPYKVYTALITQSGSRAPVVTVLENTLGTNLIWTRESTGEYMAESATSVFTQNKTMTILQFWGYKIADNGHGVSYRKNDTQLYVYLKNKSGDLVDNLGDTDLLTSIEIRVYN